MRWLLAILGAGLAVVFGPLLWLWLTVPVVTAEAARPASLTQVSGVESAAPSTSIRASGTPRSSR